MDFARALADLAGSGVSFVVVGGMLRPLYAPSNNRPTFDLDIVIARASAEALIRALYAAGYQLLTRFEPKPWTEPVIETIADVDAAVVASATQAAVSFFRDHPYALIDAWLDIGTPFEELEQRSRWRRIVGVDVAIVAADDWRRLKERAAREKDRADLEAFEPSADPAEDA